ncbi:unnamed protein product, partial [Pylaiella littoralis]
MGDVMETYVCDTFGAKTELAHLKKLGVTGGNEAAHSQANGRIATIASRMSEARTEREISLWVHDYNRSCDEHRGIAKPYFLRHFWEEERIRTLSANVQGPSPGGNLMIPPELGEADMELMGYDYLSFDQDKVAMTLATEDQMDWSKISASSSPAVVGEAPLPGGNEFDHEEQAQLGKARATSEGAGSSSFGRRGGSGRERVAGAGGSVGSGAAEIAVTGSAPLGSSSGAGALDASTGGSGLGAPSMACVATLGQRPAAAGRTGAGTGAGAAAEEQAGAGAGVRASAVAGAGPRAAAAANTRAGLRAAEPGRSSSGGTAWAGGRTGARAGKVAEQSVRLAAGPRDGQGRLLKFRRVAAMNHNFAMPTTADEQQLAGDVMAKVLAKGVGGEVVREAAAAEYNNSLNRIMLRMRGTLQPITPAYKFIPIDRTRFKQYWGDLSIATTLP